MSGTATGTLGARVRGLLRRPLRAWRHSLEFRTILISTVATTVAIIIAAVWTALAIQTELYDSRRDQTLADAKRAIDIVQSSLDNAAVATDRAATQQLRQQMLQDLNTASSTRFIAAFPIPELSSDTMPSGFTTRTDGLFEGSMVSDGLREQVRTKPESQWYQAIGLQHPDGPEIPAIVVGQQLEMPNVGVYEVYLAYPVSDVAQTLAFVRLALAIMGVGLVVIVAGVVWLVMRSVAAPIVEVSRASARLSEGDLATRLPESGQDELATLARSFNQMADSIESQIRELAELSLVQQRFVSDVSHELRTPLTTIRLAAGILHGERESFDPVTARSAELLYDQVARFEQLLADLLEISRYDAGSVELERESQSLSDVAEQVAESLRQVAWQHDTELRFHGADGDDVAEMDPRRVRRILRNLVGNAIEHGEHQPIDITVAQNETAVAVGVRDYGLGMRPEDTARVFDRFWRADPSRQRTLGGTGLGLSIALGDARLHGGSIDVWSQLGVGTHFVLTLPRGAAADMVAPIPVEPPDALTTGDLRAGNGPATETLIVRQQQGREEDT